MRGTSANTTTLFERSNAEKFAIISSGQRQRLTVFRAILCPWGQGDGGGDLGIRVLAEHLTYRDHFIDLRLRQLWNNSNVSIVIRCIRDGVYSSLSQTTRPGGPGDTDWIEMSETTLEMKIGKVR